MASNVIQQQQRRRGQQQQNQQEHHQNYHYYHHQQCSKKQQSPASQQQKKLQQLVGTEPSAATSAEQHHYRWQLSYIRRQATNNNNNLRNYLQESSLATAISSCSNKPWQLGRAGLLLSFFLLLTHGYVVHGEGNVGCHFVRTLCLEGSEVCFDDNIFGKCIPTTGVDVEDIERTPLNEDQSRTLATMLEDLQGAGLGWDHPYVQCRIQGQLFSLQRHKQLPPNLCANLAPIPAEYDPGTDAMAFVRFIPPLEDYVDANEETEHNLLYYPPMKKQTTVNTIFQELQLQDRRHNRQPYPLELTQFGGFDDRSMPAEPLEPTNAMAVFLENELARIQQEQALQEAAQEAERKQALMNRLELYRILADGEFDAEPRDASYIELPLHQRMMETRKQPPPVLFAPEESNGGNDLRFVENYAAAKRMENSEPPKSESMHRSFFRELAAEQGIEQEPIQHDYYSNALLADPLQADIPIMAAETDNDDVGVMQDEQYVLENSLLRNSLKPFEEEAMLASNAYPRKHKTNKVGHVFTEGGRMMVPELAEARNNVRMVANDDIADDDDGADKEKAREMLANMLGFTRRERLDVKKPGPLVGPPQTQQVLGALHNVKNFSKAEEGNKEVLPAHIKGSNEAHKKKKVVKEKHSEEDHAPHTVDTEYAHVFIKNPIDSWNDGVRIMNELANILHMQGYFTYLTVQTNGVSFRVDSNNPEHKTAADVARSINENRGVKNNILRRLGFTVQGAGVGDKVRHYGADSGVTAVTEYVPMNAELTLLVLLIVAVSILGGILMATLYYRRRVLREKVNLLKKGSGITGIESCSKDYQDLCRARMAGKGNAAEPVASGRITSLSKENERPPSSRSSTSSWSEEPALTNMDISTGHMVLSYMEDHLRNKGRLQREWEALCRYEAEPSARDAAQQPQCSNFNRSSAPLPYDHSRVVLNHLANAEGLDYINASTITDHDPRAPAYVAAQGPLPATLAHFWQMIWEQGAVVIVALCRLQENGEIACARYWPEEGAEVYHIYEVHLVSEHIWCDDYLVRSFYLKNLRTSETRTVTQFHFLSWPQNGVPAQAKALLDFRRKVNKSYRGRSCPIVVHGSTGAGRTGAYILLDLVLGRMNKGAREIDIAATLEHLRDQRPGLVATRQQFEFVLMAVAEEVHAILKALPANQSSEKKDIDGGAASTNGTTAATNGTAGVLKEEKAEQNEEVATTSKEAKDSATKEKLTKTDKENDKENRKEKENEKEKEKEKAKDREKDKDTAKSGSSGGKGGAAGGGGGTGTTGNGQKKK